MIYEFARPDAVPRVPMELFPPQEWGGWLIAAAALWALFLCLRPRAGAGPVLLGPSMLGLAGAFVTASQHQDEIFINLEHTWNLVHHGRFSFQPDKLVGGTVEHVYYLMLAPFAATRESLVLGNYFMAMALGLAHVAIVWRWVRDLPRVPALAALLGFTIAVPLARAFGSGFGTGLVSLVFLAALDADRRGRYALGAAFACALPLLRPDGVGLGLVLITLSNDRDIRRKALRAGACIACLGLYFVLHKIAYGVWIPVPLSFRSFAPHEMSLYRLRERALAWFIHPSHALFYVSFVASFFVRDARLARWRLYLFPLALLFFFYVTDPTPHPTPRYWIGFELFQMLFPAMLLVSLPRGALERAGVKSGVALWLAFSLLAAASFVTRRHDGERKRTALLARSGVVVDRVLPPDWKVATTELNAFGFMTERRIFDLWGYTNPAIARSAWRNRARVRGKPELFLKEAPPAMHFWNPYMVHLPRRVSGWYRWLYAVNFSMTYRQAGNMVEVMRRYDVYLIRDAGHLTTLFVRRDVTAAVRASLDAQGYRLVGEEQVDEEALARQNDRLHPLANPAAK